MLFGMLNDFFQQMSKMLVEYIIGNLASSCVVFGSGRDVLDHIHAWTYVTWNEAGKRCAIAVCHHEVFHVAMYLCIMIKQKTKRDEVNQNLVYVQCCTDQGF